jgi:hypothetical protein
MKKFFNPVLNRKAQIVLPAILLIPTIMLVIYLLFETTKLSREKIRHQFALDSAAFVELTSTANFLNAVAYTNGAFPFRLFRDNFDVTDRKIQPLPDFPDEEPVSIFDFFFNAGAFPGMSDPTSSPRPEDTEWELRYYTGKRPGWDVEHPRISTDDVYDITSKEIATTHHADFHMDSVKLYLFMYYLLSQIYENQKKVYDRITSDGEFFRKGYYFNTGNCRLSECGREGAREFKPYIAITEPVYISKLNIYYNDPYTLKLAEPIYLDLVEDDIFDGKLYQFSYLNRSSKDRIKELYKGIDINQPFVPPSNYFNINLARYRPHTHVKAALQCTKESNNCVWPSPTPKYQVRIFP